ncbi:unnamed protein product [Ixodes pacificus]
MSLPYEFCRLLIDKGHSAGFVESPRRCQCKARIRYECYPGVRQTLVLAQRTLVPANRRCSTRVRSVPHADLRKATSKIQHYGFLIQVASVLLPVSATGKML